MLVDLLVRRIPETLLLLHERALRDLLLLLPDVVHEIRVLHRLIRHLVHEVAVHGRHLLEQDDGQNATRRFRAGEV